jgi:aryl-alcohol dehydrogenase-like predicted oxidoreductase
MDQRPLGRSGLTVSRIVLGCGNFGGIGSAPQFFGQGESREEAFALMDAAVAHGITVFDTADAYGGGRSERWIGEWLAERGRPEVLVTTKVFHSVEGDPADRGLAPDRVRRQLEGSLARLRRRSVDMYVTHEPDASTPIADTLEALDELVREGKVRAVGASNIWGEQLEEALAASAERGLARFEWAQNPYSLLDRTAEREVFAICEREGLGFTPFGPLEGGWLTGKYRRGQTPPPGSRMTMRPEPYAHLDTDAVYRGIDRLEAQAARRGVRMAALALAWVLSHPLVSGAIVGPRRPAQLDVIREALALELGADERAELAAVFDPE